MAKENTPSTFVTTVDLAVANKLIAYFKDRDFEITKPPHTVFAAKKKGLSCALYQSGKLMVQGKETAEFVEFFLEPEILGRIEFTHQDLRLDKRARIGIDESGKGDFFGPLCIAGVYAKDDDIAHLKSIGVRDSKKLTDSSIIKIGSQIRKNFVHHIVKINPLKYNELHKQFGNLNHLLAWGHATTIENLVQRTDCHFVIIDQFAAEHVVITALKRKKLEVNLTQRHRAEEDLVVAAASILARQAFLEGIEALGEELGIKLPKGASAATIKAGKEIVRKHGKEALAKVGKTHFKTLDVILGGSSE